ncbi:MAG TPA: HAD family phosphatase [Bryobacteraceae bacterium]|nr:HAD family phosphatase [Bryobacteraceae bacterium]
MYRAVIFDLGRVLVNFDFQRGYQALEGICPYRTAEIRRRLGTGDLVERFETGFIEPHDFVAQLSSLLDLEIDYDRFCGIWTSIFTETLVPEEMLAGLAARYRLLLLSNTNAIHFESLRQSHTMLRHFHHLVLSYEVKAMKPQAEIFQAALAQAGCPPEECFYTDDIADYIAAARRLGIDAVQFQSLSQLQAELRARGICWE